MENQNFTSLIAEIDRAIDSGNRTELGRLQMELFGAVETMLKRVGENNSAETWIETADRFADVAEQLRMADDRWWWCQPGIIENNL